MRKLLPIFLTLTLFLPLTLKAQGRFQDFTVNAEISDHDIEHSLLKLEGQVQIMYQDQHLSCDEAMIHFRSKTIEAQGNVLLVTPQFTIGAHKIILDYSNNTGLIFEGYVQSGNVIFNGRIIQKTGDKEFWADGAQYTSCNNCPETWSFSGQRIRAQLGGYAYIKNTFLKVGGIPIFWLPYLLVPLQSERQTGLLSPELSHSDDGGLAISESLFIAINRSQDATITLKNYELRGLKELFNYRYVLDQNSYGEFDSALIRDRVFASDQRLNLFRSAESQGDIINRWFVKYEHYYILPENFIHRVQINNASDLQYPKDFPIETKNHGDSAMENRMSLTKNTSHLHFSLDTSYYVNLLQSNPLGGQDDSVHRVPELRLAQTEQKIGSLWLYSYDLKYTSFARTNFAYDNMNAPYEPLGGNNRFISSIGSQCQKPDWDKDPACFALREGTFHSEKDMIRTGQRADNKVSLSRPLKAGDFVDIMPKVTLRDTEYFFPIGNNAFNARRYLRTEVSARTHFDRIYGVDDNEGLYYYSAFHHFRHEIQPEMTLTFIPWYYHPYHPFFGHAKGDHNDLDEAPFSSQDNVGDSDVNSPYGLQFDYNDRVSDRKLLTFAITNKFIQKRWKAGVPEYLNFLTWKLSQSYDSYQAEIHGPQPLSDLQSLLNVNLEAIQIYQRANYFPYQHVTNLSTRLRLINRLKDYTELAHTRTYSITPGQDVDANTRTEELSFIAKKNFRNLDFLGKFTYDLNPLDKKNSSFSEKIKSFGYGARLKLPGDCWHFTVVQYKKTGGTSEWKANFDFSWEGKTAPSLPENLLQDYGI